jgi:mannitol-specific phosphotransferase system IIBC component
MERQLNDAAWEDQRRSAHRVYFFIFIFGAIMHIFFPFIILTMPPPLVHIAAVIFGVIIALVIMVLGAANAVEATLSVRAIRPIMILVMLHRTL